MDNTLDKNTTSMLHLTEQEVSVLDAAAFVKFGELLNVQIESSEPKVERRVTAVQAAFVKVVRDEGLTFMDIIIVHNGFPSQIEIDGMFQTIKYKRKIRFN